MWQHLEDEGEVKIPEPKSNALQVGNIDVSDGDNCERHLRDLDQAVHEWHERGSRAVRYAPELEVSQRLHELQLFLPA